MSVPRLMSVNKSDSQTQWKFCKFYEELYKFREGNGCKVSDLERDLKDLNCL